MNFVTLSEFSRSIPVARRLIALVHRFNVAKYRSSQFTCKFMLKIKRTAGRMQTGQMRCRF